MNPIQSIPSSTMQAKTCSICLATSTCKWYKDLYDETQNRCASCYQKAKRNIEKLCSTCEKIVTSSQWHKDPYDKTKNHCASCYNKAIRNIEKLCSTCEKIVTSSQWYKDPYDKTKHRCATCYQKSKNALAKFCSTCEKIVKSPHWYKDANDKEKDRCSACYQKSKNALAKFCSTCEEVVTSSLWYKDPYDNTKDRCYSCYQKSRKDIEMFCSTCEKIVTSSQWYKDPKDETKHRCRRCYDRIKPQNKKRNKSLSFGKETLLNTGSSLGNFKNIGGEFDSELSDFHAYESPEKGPESQTTTYLESHSKRKIDPPKNSSSKLQRTTNFSPANNTPLGNNLDLDSFEFDSDVIDDLWGLLEMEDSDNP